MASLNGEFRLSGILNASLNRELANHFFSTYSLKINVEKKNTMYLIFYFSFKLSNTLSQYNNAIEHIFVNE